MLLFQKKTTELEKELESLNNHFQSLVDKKSEIKNSLVEEFIKFSGISKYSVIKFSDLTYNNEDPKLIDNSKIYNIDKLNNSRSPKRILKNYYNDYRHFEKIFRSSIKVSKRFSIDGFEGFLEKTIDMKKPSKALKDLLNEYNSLSKSISKAYIDVNQLERDLICLDSDKSIKAEFIKKIIKSKDLTKLLKEQ